MGKVPKSLLAVTVLVGVLFMIAGAWHASGRGTGVVERAAADALGRRVAIEGGIDLSWSPLGLAARDVRIENARWAGPDAMLEAPLVRIELDPGALLGGRSFADRIVLVHPIFRLSRNADGEWNVPASDDASDDRRAGEIVVEEGRLAFSDAGASSNRGAEAQYRTVTTGSLTLAPCKQHADASDCWRMDALDVRVAGVPVAGELELVSRGDQRRIGGSLRIADKKDPPDGADGGNSAHSPVFDLSSFPLGSTSLDVDLELESLSAAGLHGAGPLRAHATVDQGALLVEKLELGEGAAELGGAVRITPSQGMLDIDADVSWGPVELYEMTSADLGAWRERLGTLSGRVRLHGRGRSPSDALGNAEGHVALFMSGGTIEASLLERIDVDLADLLGPLLSDSQDDGRVEIYCAVADAKIAGGTIDVSSLLVETAGAKVTGKGTIDIVDRKIDLTLTSHPNDKLDVGSLTPIRIHGPFGEVEAGPAGKGLIARVATSLALEAVVRGIGVALPFLDDVVDDGDDRCAKLLDNARSAGRGTVSDGAEARKD